MEYGYMLIEGFSCVLLVLVLMELRKIEDKLEHPDERPRHHRFWGNGKK